MGRIPKTHNKIIKNKCINLLRKNKRLSSYQLALKCSNTLKINNINPKRISSILKGVKNVEYKNKKWHYKKI